MPKSDSHPPPGSGTSTPRRGFTYHPFELALSGGTESGRRHIARRLLAFWARRFRVGLVSAEAFAQAEPELVASVQVGQGLRFTRVCEGSGTRFDRAFACVDADFVLVEHAAGREIPKILLLDPPEEASPIPNEARSIGAIAFVGQERPPAAPGELPFFHLEDPCAPFGSRGAHSAYCKRSASELAVLVRCCSNPIPSS